MKEDAFRRESRDENVFDVRSRKLGEESCPEDGQERRTNKLERIG